MESTALKPGQTPKFSWVVLILLYCSAIVAPLSMFKVGVLAPVLIPALGIAPESIGVLMSVFSIAGLILALPAGVLVAKLGAKRSILISLAFTVIGCILGAFSTSFTLLSVSRIVEGAGLGLIAVCVPSAITEWFPAKRRGVALGVFTTFMPMGNIIGLALYPSVEASMGWNAVWWFVAIVGVVLFVLVLVIYRRPNEEERLMINEGVMLAEPQAPKFKDSLKVLKKGHLWLAGIVFLLFNMCSPGGASQYMTTFFTESLGVTLTTAGLYGAITLVVIIVCEPLAGAISDKVGSRKIIVMVPLVGMFIVAWFMYYQMPDGVAIILQALFLSVFAAGIASGSYAAAPEMVDRPEDASMALGVIALCQNAGLIVGPLVYANVLAVTDFVGVAHFVFMPALALAFIIAILTKYRAVPKKKAE